MLFLTAFGENYDSINDGFGGNSGRGGNGGRSMCNPTKCQMPSSTAVCKEYIRTCVEYVGECCRTCVQDPLLLAGLSSLITSIVFWTVVRLHYQQVYHGDRTGGRKSQRGSKGKLGVFSRFFITGKEGYEEEEEREKTVEEYVPSDSSGRKTGEESKEADKDISSEKKDGSLDNNKNDDNNDNIKSELKSRLTLQNKGKEKPPLKSKEEKDLAFIRRKKETDMLVKFIIPIKIVMYLVCLVITLIAIITKPFYVNKMTLNDVFVQRSVSSCLFSSSVSGTNFNTSSPGPSLLGGKNGENYPFLLSYFSSLWAILRSLFMTFFSDYYIISLTAGISSYVIGTTWLISDQVISLIIYAYSKIKSLKQNDDSIDDNKHESKDNEDKGRCSGGNDSKNIFCTSLPIRRCLFAKILITFGLIAIRFSGSIEHFFSSANRGMVNINNNPSKDNTVMPLSPGYGTLLFSTFVLIVVSMI